MSAASPPVRIDPCLAELATRLKANLPHLADTVFAAIMSEDPGYAEMDSALRTEVRQYNERNLHDLLSALAGHGPLRIDVPKETARRRAAQGVALGTVLHAYRIGFRVIWEAILDLAGRDPRVPADQVARSVSALWSVVDVYSEAVTDAYRETLVDLARDDERRRLVQLDALIAGQHTDWTALGGTAQALGLPANGPYLCVVADLCELDPPLRRHGVSSVWRLRTDELVGIVAVSPNLGVDRITAIVGEAAGGRIGLSAPFRDLRDTATAIRLAGIARASLPPGTSGATTIEADPIAALVAADPELGSLIARSVLGSLLSQPDREHLLEVLSEWLSTGSTSEVAARMFCHRNTIRNRLAKIEQLTHKSLARPSDAAALYAALCAQRLMP